MKNLTTFLSILAVFGVAVSCNAPAAESGSEVSLFVEGATDWVAIDDASWSFENGELVGRSDSTSGFILHNTAYENFVLTLEFKPDSTINSGVYIRCGENGITPTNCFEINIWDLHPNQNNRTGAVVLKAAPLAYVETLNKWNTYKITCNGNRIQAWVNDVQTVDLTDDEFPKGFVALQSAGTGEIRFRNVKLKVIEN